MLLVMTVTAATAAVKGQTLRGRVVDAAGQPVVGAVVNLGEGLKMALTDNEGYFTLKKVENDDEIFVNYLGYDQARQKPVFDGTMTVVLTPHEPYTETTAVPFGRKQKKLVTEATSVVTGEELEKHPVTVLQNAFTATLTGVETYEANSEPGWSQTQMFIRGLRTMNANARTPLIIVDDVERDLSFLDAYPIETITVLKDAAASAIYGMRGANGVILVTTKRGEPGKLKIDFTHEFGLQTITGKPENQNSYNYALTTNQARYLDGLTPLYSDYDIEQWRKVSSGETLEGMDKYRYFNTNWAEEMLRDLSPQSRSNIQLSGGNDRTRYYVSFSYLRQEGIYNNKWTSLNSGYNNNHALNRYNLRVNVDVNVNKFLTIGLDLGGRIDNILQPGMDTWNLFCFGATETAPIYPIHNPDGSWYTPANSSDHNGVAQLSGRGIEQNRLRNLYTTVTATGDLSSLIDGLKAKAVVSFDSYETFYKLQHGDYSSYSYDIRKEWESVDEIMESLSPSHTFQKLVLTTRAREYYYNVNTRFGLSYDHTFGKHAIGAQAFMRTYQHVVRGMNSSERYLSWNAQANYAYDGRYLLSANFSRMGNDNFAPDNRWDNFWGVSAGWVLSEEKFMKKLNVFDLLKLRASYGKAGQSVTGAARYPFQSTYAIGAGYNFGTSQSYVEGAYESTVGNSNNIWEVSRMVNVGFDFDVRNKAFYGSFDWFKEWRSQILVSRSSMPTILGVDAPLDSYGKAETWGFEATVGHQGHVGKNFTYYAELGLTVNRNKITEMDELTPNYPYEARTGQRINQSYMLLLDQWASDPALIPASVEDAVANPEKYPYNTAGVYKLGNAVFRDVNGDRQIDADDKVPAGYAISDGLAIPELLPSLRLGFQLYGFDARAVLTAYLNRTVACRENMDMAPGWGDSNFTHEVTKTWGYYTDDPTDPRNINAKYPRLSTSWSAIDRSYPNNESSIFLQNGDFLSLRNVEVGYSLPKRLIAKLWMTKCRIYFSAYNIYNWSHMPKGFDPENPTNYVWTYPKTRSFSFGVNVGF